MVAGMIGFSHSAEAQEWEVHEGHAVRGNRTGHEPLYFKHTDAQNSEEFIDICREDCYEGDGDGANGVCGGFVVNYADMGKAIPKYCVFKLRGSQPYEKSGKDTHLLAKSCHWEEDDDGTDMEAGLETGISEDELQRRIHEAVTEALMGMVAVEDMEIAVDAAVAEARVGMVPQSEVDKVVAKATADMVRKEVLDSEIKRAVTKVTVGMVTQEKLDRDREYWEKQHEEKMSWERDKVRTLAAERDRLYVFIDEQAAKNKKKYDWCIKQRDACYNQ
jgi:hypothetical protein